MGFYIFLGMTEESEVSHSFTTCFEEKFQIKHINWTKFHPISKNASSNLRKQLPNPTQGIPHFEENHGSVAWKELCVLPLMSSTEGGERQKCNHGFQSFGSMVCSLWQWTRMQAAQEHMEALLQINKSHRLGNII